MACSYAAALSSKIKMYKNARIHTLIKTVSQYGTSRPATTFQFSMFGTGIRCRVSLADPRSAITSFLVSSSEEVSHTMKAREKQRYCAVNLRISAVVVTIVLCHCCSSFGWISRPISGWQQVSTRKGHARLKSCSNR